MTLGPARQSLAGPKNVTSPEVFKEKPPMENVHVRILVDAQRSCPHSLLQPDNPVAVTLLVQVTMDPNMAVNKVPCEVRHRLAYWNFRFPGPAQSRCYLGPSRLKRIPTDKMVKQGR